MRNEGYKTGSINYAFETKTFNYDRGIRLMADVKWSLTNTSARSTFAPSRYKRATGAFA